MEGTSRGKVNMGSLRRSTRMVGGQPKLPGLRKWTHDSQFHISAVRLTWRVEH
jgi:hypothetical protein